MDKPEMNGDAKRAVAKFAAVLALAAVSAVCVWEVDGVYKTFLFTVAGGLCCRMAWPNEVEGGALMDYFRGDSDD